MATLTFNGTNGSDVLNDYDGRGIYDEFLGYPYLRFDLVYINGFDGDDNISGFYITSSYNINGGAGNDALFGNLNNDVLAGDDPFDLAFGDNDYLAGLDGNDALYGFGGNDTLNGGAGTDTLYGVDGNDVFQFDSVSDSQPGLSRDIIKDFVGNGIFAGDQIDVSIIDANSTLGGNQAFTFIGTRAFTAASQVRYSGGILQANTDGDLSAEFEIGLTGTPSLVANDIIL